MVHHRYKARPLPRFVSWRPAAVHDAISWLLPIAIPHSVNEMTWNVVSRRDPHWRFITFWFSSWAGGEAARRVCNVWQMKRGSRQITHPTYDVYCVMCTLVRRLLLIWSPKNYTVSWVFTVFQPCQTVLQPYPKAIHNPRSSTSPTWRASCELYEDVQHVADIINYIPNC